MMLIVVDPHVLHLILLDVDECASTDDGVRCSPETEKCVNTVGSYRCDCAEGFQRRSGKCEAKKKCKWPKTLWFRFVIIVSFLKGLVAILLTRKVRECYRTHKQQTCLKAFKSKLIWVSSVWAGARNISRNHSLLLSLQYPLIIFLHILRFMSSLGFRCISCISLSTTYCHVILCLLLCLAPSASK